MTGVGGKSKPTTNDIEQVLADASTVVRFSPVLVFETPSAMDSLHRGFSEEVAVGNVILLLLIATYVLDFQCIHPFHDGNGRMIRPLTLLLLHKSGFEVGRYVSLKMTVETQRQAITTRSTYRRRAGMKDVIRLYRGGSIC